MKYIEEYGRRVTDNVARVIVGHGDVLDLMMVTLLSGGHALLEDVPGVGKTMLARALAASLGVDFKRIQCTPDLLPSDITGVSIFDQRTQSFEFVAGPVFANVLLVDEINRATPRAQSALLEAMAERQVTVDGVTHELSPPFLVMATQNPIEYEGTFALPEAQLDRFFMRLNLGYPSPAEESTMLEQLAEEHPIESLTAVVDGAELPALMRSVRQVHVDTTVREYIVRLTGATRDHRDLALGASPRASLALFRGAQAWAALRGREYVLPDDVKSVASSVLVHRCIVNPESALRGNDARRVVDSVLQDTVLDVDDC